MILELVLFRQPEGLTRAQEYDGARHVVDKWLANPDHVAKHFVRDEDGWGGAVYIWPSREAAAAAHDDAWRASVLARTGHAPTIRIFELMMTVDGATKTLRDYE